MVLSVKVMRTIKI